MINRDRTRIADRKTSLWETMAKFRRTKEEGERELTSIARRANQEHAWVFDGEKDIWYYYSPKRHLEKTTKEEARLGFELPEELAIPSTEHASMYHIHPDVQISKLVRKDTKAYDDIGKAVLEVKLQIPSSEDLSSLVTLTKEGYREFNIVTSRGVTVCQFHCEAVDPETEILHGFTIEEEKLREFVAQGGVEKTIEECMKFINNHYKGAITVRFKKIS